MRVNALDYISARMGLRGPQQQAIAEADDESSPIFVMSSIMTFSTGIFLTAARFVEPLFRNILFTKYH